ncbi:MAG: winged helix-turn-helix domain-containing protein [Candidatus Levybacteria bacterium]|nr:winged helix-turn-helix domain-containing protein [Candidatus Levybacteria bacterium]
MQGQFMLADLITSQSRIKLLNVLLEDPTGMYHVREFVRRTGDEINAVRRELLFLEKKGILVREPRSNRVYYSLSKTYPFYFDLLRLGSKVTGLGAGILKNRVKIGKIKYAMFSGRFTRRMEKRSTDVDLIIVGTIVLPELAILIRDEEKRLGREINYTVMTEEEFSFRKKKRDPFILSVLSGSRVMLFGDEESMLA